MLFISAMLAYLAVTVTLLAASVIAPETAVGLIILASITILEYVTRTRG